jgi:hypothetical protein
MCDLLELQKISTKVVDFGSQNVKWYHLVHLGTKVVVLCYSLVTHDSSLRDAKHKRGGRVFYMRGGMAGSREQRAVKGGPFKASQGSGP